MANRLCKVILFTIPSSEVGPLFSLLDLMCIKYPGRTFSDD